MPSKERGKYRGQVRWNGQRRSKLFERKKDAAEWERLTLAEMKKINTQEPQPRLKGFWAAYLDHAEKFSQKTYEEKAYLCGRMLKAMGEDASIHDVTPQKCLDFLSARARSQSGYAANKDLKNIRSFYSWLRKFRGIQNDPTRDIARWPHTPADKTPPSQADVLKVLAVASREERIFLLTYLHTGARRSELFRLTWDDVNLEKKAIRLTTIKTRDASPKQAWIPMTDELHRELSWWYAHRPVKAHHVFVDVSGSEKNPNRGQPFKQRRWLLPRLCEKAKVKPFGFHAFRHLFASMLADSGKMGLPTIQKLLRHESARTTEIYLHSLSMDAGAALNEIMATPNPKEDEKCEQQS